MLKKPEKAPAWLASLLMCRLNLTYPLCYGEEDLCDAKVDSKNMIMYRQCGLLVLFEKNLGYKPNTLI